MHIVNAEPYCRPQVKLSE